MTKSDCTQSHYATIVDPQKDVEVYQLGDLDCADCLRRMVRKHEALAEVFREKFAALAGAAKRCRVYDAACMNPIYCDARDACCAGDPACRAEVP